MPSNLNPRDYKNARSLPSYVNLSLLIHNLGVILVPLMELFWRVSNLILWLSNCGPQPATSTLYGNLLGVNSEASPQTCRIRNWGWDIFITYLLLSLFYSPIHITRVGCIILTLKIRDLKLRGLLSSGSICIWVFQCFCFFFLLPHFFFLTFYFILEYSWLTMLC